MRFHYTAGARRALRLAQQSTADSNQVGSPALLLAFFNEPECRAAHWLESYGVSLSMAENRWPNVRQPTHQETNVQTPSAITWSFSPDVELGLREVQARCWAYPKPLELATEHLLLGLTLCQDSVAEWLAEQGLHAAELEQKLHQLHGYQPTVDTLGPPLDLEETPPQVAILSIKSVENSSAPPPELGPPRDFIQAEPFSETVGLIRAFDAAFNRAREALRVIEDYVRFVLDDRHLTNLLKQLRHSLTAAASHVSRPQRLACRETQADVGTQLSTPQETTRPNAAAVLAANFGRLAESLRSLEEYGKVFQQAGENLGGRFESLRYQAYTLERAVESTRNSLHRLAHAQLYVLLDGQANADDFSALVVSLIRAGVDILQLRDKQLADRELLARARLLRELTQGTSTLFIMNDRPDLALLSAADGVHVGQEELTVKDARRLLGTDRLIGVSTHSLAQARQAVLDGADYLGAGPTFPTPTKSFAHFPGLPYIQAVSQEIRLPTFVIGGVTLSHLPTLFHSGATRVAVSSSILSSPSPSPTAHQFKYLLTPHRPV